MKWSRKSIKLYDRINKAFFALEVLSKESADFSVVLNPVNESNNIHRMTINGENFSIVYQVQDEFLKGTLEFRNSSMLSLHVPPDGEGIKYQALDWIKRLCSYSPDRFGQTSEIGGP